MTIEINVTIKNTDLTYKKVETTQTGRKHIWDKYKTSTRINLNTNLSIITLI